MSSNDDLINEDNLIRRMIETSLGGQLNPEQLDNFVGLVVDQSGFLSRISIYSGIEASELELHTLGFASRVIRKGVEGVAPGDLVDPTISKRTLKPVEIILPFDITNKFMRQNIAKGKADAVINDLVSKQFRNDSVDLGINGDTASGDDFVKILDGLIKKMKAVGSNVNKDSFAAADKNKDIFNAMLRKMPNKWKQNVAELIYLVSPSRYEDYQDELSDKNTLLGDKALTERPKLYYKGIEIVPEATMPDTEVGLFNPLNIAYGVGADFMIEREYRPRKRATEFTVTANIDFNFAVGEAIVLYTQE